MTTEPTASERAEIARGIDLAMRARKPDGARAGYFLDSGPLDSRRVLGWRHATADYCPAILAVLVEEDPAEADTFRRLARARFGNAAGV